MIFESKTVEGGTLDLTVSIGRGKERTRWFVVARYNGDEVVTLSSPVREDLMAMADSCLSRHVEGLRARANAPKWKQGKLDLFGEYPDVFPL